MEALVMSLWKKAVFVFLLLIPVILAFAAPIYAKALVYRWSSEVNIYITSAPCSIDKYKDKYPYAAKAVKTKQGKIDNLVGCFTGKDGIVVIQWQDINGKPTDTTGLDANLFEELTQEDKKDMI